MLVYPEFVSDLSNRSVRENRASKLDPLHCPLVRMWGLEFVLSWLALMMKVWIGSDVYLDDR